MEQSELLEFLVSQLEQLQIPYFITGSIAAIFFGEPRFTNDIDVVLDLRRHRVDAFYSVFSEPDFYSSQESIHRAVTTKTQFNVIHPSSGLKIDFMIPKDSLFNRSRFSRIQRIEPAVHFQANFTSAEDVIIKKMEFFKLGHSEKHLRDIDGILKVSGETLDYEYIESWADSLGLETLWRTLRRQNSRISP